MKRIISLFTAVIILLAITPFGAVAAGTEQSEYDELIDLACEVFPEYASTIRGENINTYGMARSGEANEIIYSETRNISETEQLSLYQMRSGDAVVLYNGTLYYDLIEQSSSSSNITTVGVTGTSTFKVAGTTTSQVYVLSNVSYTIYYNGSDYFSNYGTVTTDTFYDSHVSNSSRYILHTLNFSGKAADVIELRLKLTDENLLEVYLG